MYKIVWLVSSPTATLTVSLLILSFSSVLLGRGLLISILEWQHPLQAFHLLRCSYLNSWWSLCLQQRDCWQFGQLELWWCHPWSISLSLCFPVYHDTWVFTWNWLYSFQFGFLMNAYIVASLPDPLPYISFEIYPNFHNCFMKRAQRSQYYIFLKQILNSVNVVVFVFVPMAYDGEVISSYLSHPSSVWWCSWALVWYRD
jgi:hypothetical protein